MDGELVGRNGFGEVSEDRLGERDGNGDMEKEKEKEAYSGKSRKSHAAQN